MVQKGKVEIEKMEVNQCLNWLEEILNKAALGTTEEVAMPEVFKRLKQIMLFQQKKLEKQDEVINYALDKLARKDIIHITKVLIER